MTKKTHMHTALMLSGFFICLDQFLKYLAYSHPTVTLYMVRPWLGWEYFGNPGIAFSIPFPNWLLLLVTPLILFVLLLLLFTKKHLSLSAIYALALIIGGALSNYIDRMLVGVTIDYLRILTSIMNLGDLMITTGAVLLLMGEIKKKKLV